MAFDSLSLNDYPEFRPYIGPDSTPPQRMMAARGLVALAPAKMAALLFLLTKDEDSGIGRAAEESFDRLPDGIKLAVAGDPNAHPAVLHFLAKRSKTLSPETLEKLILNHAADDRSIALLARDVSNPRILETISHNQTRLDRYPMIAHHLIDNDNLSLAFQERIRHYVEADIASALKASAAAAAAAKPEEALEAEIAPEVAEGDVDLSAFWNEEARDIEAGYRSFIDDEMVDDEGGEGDADNSQETTASMYKLVLTLKTSQKIKLAMSGNKEARNLLIKESNKMIKTAVLKNPRITDAEVVSHCQSRSMSEDVLRMIANNREWMKLNQVKYGLAANPKTPIPISMRLINVLSKREIANLAKDRNISSVIQTAARRRLQAMNTKKGGSE